MVKYVGQSNAYDIPNNVIYLGDLLYAWDVGDDLTGWTLGGTTVPTIAVDGRMDLNALNGAGNGISSAYILVPNTLGEFLGIIHAKMTRMIDDSSTYNYDGSLWLGDNVFTGGMIQHYDPATPTMWCRWYSPGGGVVTNSGRPLTAGQEYSVDIVKTAKDIIYLLNNTLIASTPVSSKGTVTSLPQLPQLYWRQTQKYIGIYMRANINERTHWRVRDIRVSRYVGKNHM